MSMIRMSRRWWPRRHSGSGCIWESAVSRDSEIDAPTEDRASDDDRQWFKARPDRRYRFRPRLSRELGGDADTTHVLVVQMCPGARTRRGVCWMGAAMPADSDEQLGRLFHLICAGEPAYVLDGHVMGFEDLPGVRQ